MPLPHVVQGQGSLAAWRAKIAAGRQVCARSHPLKQCCLGLHGLQGQSATGSSVALRLPCMPPCLPLHTAPKGAARGGASASGGLCPPWGSSGLSGWGCTQMLDVGLLLAHLLLQGSVLCLEALQLPPEVSDLQHGGHSSSTATAGQQSCASNNPVAGKDSISCIRLPATSSADTLSSAGSIFCQPQQSC